MHRVMLKLAENQPWDPLLQVRGRRTVRRIVLNHTDFYLSDAQYGVLEDATVVGIPDPLLLRHLRLNAGLDSASRRLDVAPRNSARVVGWCRPRDPDRHGD